MRVCLKRFSKVRGCSTVRRIPSFRTFVAGMPSATTEGRHGFPQIIDCNYEHYHILTEPQRGRWKDHQRNQYRGRAGRTGQTCVADRP